VLDRPDFGKAGRVLVHPMKWRPLQGGAAVFFGLTWLLGTAALMPQTAWATHETDHRFTVSGYVRDRDGKPVKDARVYARDLGDESVEPVTTYADSDGFYQVILHLHDKNAGDAVQVSAKDERSGFDEIKKIRAEFTPGDRHTERQARVDFGPESDKSAGGSGGPIGTADASRPWLYAVGGGLALAAIGVAVARARHRQAGVGSKRRKKKRSTG